LPCLHHKFNRKSTSKL